MPKTRKISVRPSSRFAFPDAPGDLLGAHVSTKGGVHNIFERGAEIGAGALAFFSKNSNQWKARPLTDGDCDQFIDLRGQAGMQPVVIHAAYLINLAAVNEEFLRKSIETMIVELERADRLGVHAVVLHPGAHMGAGVEAGLDSIARSLDEVHAALPQARAVTLLETSAGQGSSLGCSFAELGAILRRVDDPSRLGICFDTCHAFSAGYDLRTRDGYERVMDELEREVGAEHVGAFHLNDSKRDLGARVDRHEHIGKGFLGLDAFGLLVNDRRFAGIPKLIETPKTTPIESDRENLATLRSLLG